ncbi:MULTISPECIES: BT4734/BF3469 family protein [Sphingobacterium]|uniref:BT4734/BF3469 family protein n=1 Tax=Sphingobacterium populi TaxID=1812824 RepID=A0ABW5U9X7_9SPHI|nr:BT4734/BF3469 family protein [Sphingobacterium sp. CFCC 11742]
MNTYKFSYYPGPIRSVVPQREITLQEAVEMIRSDRFKAEVLQIRNADNPDIRRGLKNTLPYFTFSGTFTKRIADALKSHSGLIVLDFDDIEPKKLEQLKKDFSSIDFVALVFISPSGAGLKVVVKIDGEKRFPTVAAYQQQAFRSLAQFFDDNFQLAIDESGKDVPRVCFTSWDSNLYFNATSKVYPVSPDMDEALPSGDIATARAIVNSDKKESDAETQFSDNKTLLRVKHVVEQLESRNLDLTSGYDDWQLIAFSLASLGESAREYFHRVSQIYAFYDHKAADDKFTDAIKKGRFKSAAKFFSLANAYGLDSKLPRTIQEAQKANEAFQIIGNRIESDDYIKYGLYFKQSTGTYWSLDLKGIAREISNFKLRVLYHINTGADEAYRLMQITNVHGLDKILRINTDDFVSAGSFKKVIARLGNFIFKGADQDLVRLQDMLQRHELHTENISTLGWNKRGKFYGFANGLFDTTQNTFHKIDEFGIVTKEKDGQKVNYFIPALSKVFADKDDLFMNEKKFIYIDSPVKYEDWAKQYVQVFGENGRIGLVFWVCALFSDILFKSMGLRMPMPFSYGKRGSGKGTMTQSLTRMWGLKQDQIMLGGATTIVGFMRKMAQFSNGLVWLDEYKNNLPIKVIESIKNLYDRIGYERGKKDNGFTTESTPILSAVWLSGQEMPTAEPALFTRHILLTFAETKRTEEQRKNYRDLQRMEDLGLSHLTMDMLKNREHFAKDFQGIYEATLRELATDVNNNEVDERLLGNYSMLLAVAKMMDKLNMLPFAIEDFKKQCIDMVMHQYFILKGSDDTSKFWQVVEQLVTTYQISEDDHFKLANGYIYIYLQDVYHHYVKAMHDRREVNVLDKPTLENYLKSDSKSYVGRIKKKIGKKYSYALQFNYKELDVDLIRDPDETKLRQKYEEMKLEYNPDKEESGSSGEEGFPPAQQLSADF